MTSIPLPSSFVECVVLLAAGWFATTAQAALISPQIKEAGSKFLRRVTFPAFVFQLLAAGGSFLGYSAVAAATATCLHLVLSFVICRFVTRSHRSRRQALLTGLSLGYEAESWSIAWCSVMWGMAGAQAAALFACAASVLCPLFTWAAYNLGSIGVPAELKHADGGAYTGQWSGSVKEGLGVYWYPNNAWYEGWWKGNMKHGHGVYHYADGGRFEGQFSGGARNGIGVRVWPHGTVKAAYFKNNRRMRDVDLADAADIMQAANEAADAARQITPSRISLSKAVKSSLLSGPVVACSLFLLAAWFSWPVGEGLEMLLVSAAAMHIPLSLVLCGAGLPTSLPEKRHAPPVCTVLATRTLTALLVAAGVMLCTTPTIDHAIRAAAITACLLSPVSLQAAVQAKELKLSASLTDGIVVASTILSLLSMGMFSLQAWAKDIVPVFAAMPAGSFSAFPLVDHCFIQLALLSLAAFFGPRLFARKVVRMTLKASSVLHEDAAGTGGQNAGGSTTQGDFRPGPASALTHQTLTYNHKVVWQSINTRHGRLRAARRPKTKVPVRHGAKSTCTMMKMRL